MHWKKSEEINFLKEYFDTLENLQQVFIENFLEKKTVKMPKIRGVISKGITEMVSEETSKGSPYQFMNDTLKKVRNKSLKEFMKQSLEKDLEKFLEELIEKKNPRGK